MRNKDLKRLLKAKASEIEVKDFTNEIINRVDHRPQEQAKPKRRLRPFAYASSLVLALSLCVVITLFAIRPSRDPNTPSVVPTPGPITSLSKQEMVLSKEAVALGNVVEAIDSITNINNSLCSLAEAIDDDDSSSEDDDEDNDDEKEDNEGDNERDDDGDDKIDPSIYKNIALEMNAFLYVADTFINSENLEASVEANNDSSIPYSLRMNVIMLDEGFKKEYILYYDEEKSGSLAKIDGIIVIDGKAHTIKGERKDKNDETELKLKLYLDSSSYIEIENETEVNENEYEYNFYHDNELIKSIKMEIEAENGMKEASIEILENGIIKEVELEYFSDHVIAEYKNGSLELTMNIKIFDSYYIYYFDDGSYEIKLDK